MRLTYAQWVLMRDHIMAQLPEEACGLIGGQGDEARLVLPVTNELHSPVRFRMSPQEQLDAFLRFEQAGLELIGIFHSHPRGPATPSPTDIAEWMYADVKSLIWAPRFGLWSARAFIMGTSVFQEQPLIVELGDRRPGVTG